MYERQNSNSRISIFVNMADHEGPQIVPIYQGPSSERSNSAALPFASYSESIIKTGQNTHSDISIPSTVLECNLNFDSTNEEETTARDNDLSKVREGVQNVTVSSTSVMEQAPKSGQTIADTALARSGYDQTLMEAEKQVLFSGSLMPLIKEELKYSIQSKRLKEGKKEMKVEFAEPVPDVLTPEEEVKVEKRRVQNRDAARRFRDRQKSRADELQKQCHRLQSHNTQLQHEVSRLQKQSTDMRNKLLEHEKVCPLKFSTGFYKDNS